MWGQGLDSCSVRVYHSLVEIAIQVVVVIVLLIILIHKGSLSPRPSHLGPYRVLALKLLYGRRVSN